MLRFNTWGVSAVVKFEKINISNKQPSLLCPPGSLSVKSVRIKNCLNTESKSLERAGSQPNNDKILKTDKP